eukprot:TRINITY_DN4814_c0_g1_i1.p1 TRINITY_DN4814_c0_g1~~TRINITY_DN4814_c0_g1_i1.p1  ORF type:complete len:225 (-),score=50.61 TRINITY_DN4814_c0_g1_i1:79-753(-)
MAFGQLRHLINFFKGLTLPYCLLLIIIYDNWSYEALVYAALHGGYGICWVLKDYYFPDKNWTENLTVSSFVKVSFGLSLYWLAPYLLISDPLYKTSVPQASQWSDVFSPSPSPVRVALTLLIYQFGMIFHFVSDAHKYFVLNARKGLIEDGLFALCRHPNYFGEFLIYFSFFFLTMRWQPFLVNLLFLFHVFVPNMLAKEKSMKRHEGWEAYCRRTKFFIPYVY